MEACGVEAETMEEACDNPTVDEEHWSTSEDDDEDDEDRTGNNNGGSSAALTTKQTIFPCTWTTGSCTKTFPTFSRMQDHVRAVHRSKRFTCKECTKGFTYMCDVKRHHNRLHKQNPPMVLSPVKASCKRLSARRIWLG
ncbi:hypothetical protein T484DRAFT_1990114 [Baffinella frigidus]|nr:hypothetical protein T484DRAFT_1990114 [Cryptophyta sp. CCMP2293]